MTMTKEDKAYFLSIGNRTQDLKQLDCAIREVFLTLHDKKTGKSTGITNAKAIEVLGRETFLSGISRSAFHATATRESTDGRYSVSFDLKKWWR